MQLSSSDKPVLGNQPGKQGSCLKGRYILVRTLPLAEPGGLYAGRDQRTGEVLRIRAIPTGNLGEAVRVHLREAARRLMAIRRPDYFPRVRDLVETEGFHYLVQEGIKGITLRDFLNKESPPLPDRFRIAHIFRQIADRLSYLHNHTQGTILFRDLTPERVVIDTATRRIRLVDFEIPGIAAGTPQGKPEKGTRQFQAPELYKGEPHTVLTDVYALGRILQFIVFGETEEDPTPSTPIPTAVGRGVPDTLRELVQRMIAPDPSLRPNAIQAAKDSFEAFLDPANSTLSVAGTVPPREHCNTCGAEMEQENIFCPSCGTPCGRTGSDKTVEGNENIRFQVAGLEEERFLGLKSISLERFSLMKMNADVARLGGYESLVERNKDSSLDKELPLVETLQVLRDLRGRALLVGEDPIRLQRIAGSLLAEYTHRNWVERTLVLAPGNLARRWKRNLYNRHGLKAEVFGREEDADSNAFENLPVIITSSESLQDRPERKIALATCWDLVIVDAAHLCTSRGSHRWQLLEGLKSKYLLLLTPTPIQDDISDLLNLLRLVRPDLWNTSHQEFRTALDNALPSIRNKIERTMVEVKQPEDVPEIQTTYILAKPEGEAADLYKVILNSLANNDVEPNTDMLIKRALTSASPELLRAASEDEGVATLITGVKALLDDDRHPKIHHLLHGVASHIKGKALILASDAELRLNLATQLTKAGMPALSADSEKDGLRIPAWKRFVESEEIRFLVLGDEDLIPLPRNVAETVVLFDLPWDPARVADRISMLCSAYKSERKIQIIQLLATGTVEEWLYDLYQDSLKVYMPSSPMLYAFQAAMDEEESFERLVQETAAAGTNSGHASRPAQDIQERISGIHDHVESTRKRSEDVLRLIRRREAK